MEKNSTSATLVATGCRRKKKKKNANFRNISRSNHVQISFIKRIIRHDLFERSVTRKKIKFIQELARTLLGKFSSE